MATTRLEYTGDGNTVTFSLGTIDLINRSDLKVYIFEPSRDSNTAVLQSEATNAGTAGTSHPQYDASNSSGSNAGSIAATTPVNNYQFNSGNTQITLNTDNGVAKPTSSAIITLERITSEVQSDFSSQGTIRATELNSELRRIQHIAEEGVNEAKLSIKESKFSSNAVDVAHPVSGIDRKIEHVADADSDDDAVNRRMLRKVIFDDLIEGEGIDLTDSMGSSSAGNNSGGTTVISGEDSSKSNKGIVTINEGEAIDVNYTHGDAVISAENSTKSNKGVLTINSGHGVKVGPSDESDAGYDGNVVISADRSTPTAQGIIKLNQVSGDAINVTHAVNGTVGDVSVGVDRSTASQQGVVRVQSSVPITTTYTSDGEVSLSINDNTIDLAKIRNDDVITSSELDASTTTSNYPTPDWDSDDSIATGKALAKRFDAIMYSHTTNKGTPPTETNWTEGKIWYDHLNDQTLSMWEKTGANTGVWRAITSGGTFTSQPKVVYVDSVNGSDLNDGHRIIKAKKTIRGALLDVNENISSTTTTNVTAATYNHQTGLLTVTTNAAHNLRVGMKVTMAGLVWSCNYGGGTNNHTFPEADDPLRFVSNILSNTQFECQLEPTVDTNLAHTYVSGGTVTNQAGRVGQGWMISVAAGTYQEVLPLRVEADNVSIVGTTMRSCFIHPSNTQRYDTSKDFNASDAVTSGTSEYNTMFEMNSGTYIWGFAFSGLKAGGWTTSGGSTASARGDATGYVPEASRNEQRTNVDPDSTYGLPPVHGWIAAFRPNCSLKKSPYIQNCTSISDTDINNAAYDPVTQTGGLGGDKDSGMTAGGILVDGSVPSATSPLRSFVVDAFTQINMDGPGILCTNNGYAQLVSFFGTFCHYHAKSLNGGMLNLANCTTDYGRYGLIADGKSATTTFTSTVDGAKAAGQTSFNIDATTITSGYHGTGFNNSTANLRPGDNYLVKIGSDTYEIVSATPVGGSWTATSGWTVTIMKTNSTNPAINDGLTNAIADGATVSFYQRSYISTGGHTFEYVGAGTDYRAAPENGGVPIEANEVINRNMGKVWQSSTNHVGKFKVGETFTIDQRSGKVESKGITLTGPITTNGNSNITIDPAGSGVVNIGSTFTATSGSVIGNVTIANGSITDSSGAISFGDENLTTTGSITGGSLVVDTTTINAATITDSTGAISFGDENLSTTGTLSAGNTTVGTLGASGNVTFNTGNITTANNADLTLTPHGSGKVVIDALNWPTADGTANYYLQTNGSGQLQWAPAASTSSPTISNPTVTGNLVVTDNLRLNDDDDSHSITITAPTTVPSNVVLTLPSGAPSANQYLKAGASTPTTLEWENALAITTVQTANSESAQLGLTTQEGDVVIRSDESKTYIRNSGTAGNMNDFTLLQTPTSGVTSVNGQTGAVTVATDKIEEQNTFVEVVDGGSNGHVKIQIDGSEKCRFIDSSLAIGTDTVASGVAASANSIVIKGTADAGMTIMAGDDDQARVNFTDEHRNVGGSIEYNNDGDSLSFTTNNSEKMLLNSTGNLGLGTSSPTSPNGVNKFAHIHNADHSSLVLSDDQNTWEIVSNNNLTIRDGTDTRLTIDTSGNTTLAGTVTATSFSGSGANLTNLPASGGTITATAHGSIGANAAVIVRSDGKVSTITGVSASNGSEANGGMAKDLGSGSYSDQAHNFSSDYSTLCNKIAAIWYEDRGQNTVYAAIGIVNTTNNTVSWGTKQIINQNTCNWCDIVWTSTNRIYMAYTDGSITRARWADVSSSSTGTTFTLNSGGHANIHGYQSEQGCLCAPGQNSGKCFVALRSSQTGKIGVQELDYNGNHVGYSGGYGIFDSAYNMHPRMVWCPEKDCIAVSYVVSGGTYNGRGQIMLIAQVSSSYNYRVNNQAYFHGGHNNDIIYPNIGWDPDKEKLLAFYGDDSTSNPNDQRVVEIGEITGTGGSVVPSMTGTVLTNNAWTAKYYEKIQYDSDKKRFMVLIRNYSDERVYYQTVKINDDNATVTCSTPVQLSGGSVDQRNNEEVAMDMSYFGTGSWMVMFDRQVQGTGTNYIKERLVQFAATDATTGNFIGFSSAAYSDGNTATINVVGSTSTQSGLTAGKKYYVQNNGTLSQTEADPILPAGIALSSTSLLVKG